MEYGVYSIRDAKTEQFMEPWLSHTDESAERAFRDLLKDGSRPPAQHPEDYYLFRVGTWTPSLGTIQGQDPKNLLWAAACVRPMSVPTVAEAAAAAAKEVS